MLQETVNTGTILRTESKYPGGACIHLNAYNTTPYGTNIKHLTYAVPEGIFGQQWTLEFWVKVFNANAHMYGSTVRIASDDGKAAISINNSNTSMALYLNGEYKFSYRITEGTFVDWWSHIALQHDPDTGITFYVNGKKAGTFEVHNLFRNVQTGTIDFSCSSYHAFYLDSINFQIGCKYSGDTYEVPHKEPEVINTFTPSGEPSDDLHEETVLYTSEYPAETEQGAIPPFSTTTTESVFVDSLLPELTYTGSDTSAVYRFRHWELNSVYANDSTAVLNNPTLTAVWSVVTPAVGDPVDCYIRGSMNGWEADAAWQFVWDGTSDYYEITGVELAGEWKIASTDWNTINYGGHMDYEWPTYNEMYALAQQGSNLYTVSEGAQLNIKFYFNTGEVFITEL